jgi:hypothetical protein
MDLPRASSKRSRKCFPPIYHSRRSCYYNIQRYMQIPLARAITDNIADLGSAFTLMGLTSPSSGNYSVFLQPLSPSTDSSPIARSLTARSSFTQDHSLLFFATGLNESDVYSVEVINDGGLLSLDVGGFAVLGLNGSGISLPCVIAFSGLGAFLPND